MKTVKTVEFEGKIVRGILGTPYILLSSGEPGNKVVHDWIAKDVSLVGQSVRVAIHAFNEQSETIDVDEVFDDEEFDRFPDIQQRRKEARKRIMAMKDEQAAVAILKGEFQETSAEPIHIVVKQKSLELLKDEVKVAINKVASSEPDLTLAQAEQMYDVLLWTLRRIDAGYNAQETLKAISFVIEGRLTSMELDLPTD